MRYFFVKIKKHIRTLAHIVIVFGAAFLVLLYFLGYYDFSFLDRYNILADFTGNAETSQNPFADIDLGDIGTQDTQAPSDNASGETSPSDTSAAKPTAPASPTTTAKVFSPDELSDHLIQLPTYQSSLDEGYSALPSDGSFTFDGVFTDENGTVTDNDSNFLAKMTFDFKLPSLYSSSTRTVTDQVIITPWNSGEDTDSMTSDEGYVEVRTIRERRPSVELYMGYIILDDGEQFYLLSSEGKPLCRYDANRYTPAYTRDADDHPLFMRDDNGTIRYFYLSDDGTSFVLSDYDPSTDNRGLYFDYPADYGRSDSTSVFVVNNKPEIIKASADVSGEPDNGETDELELADVPESLWWEYFDTWAEWNEWRKAKEQSESSAIQTGNSYIEEGLLFGYEVRNAEGAVTGTLAPLKFTTAYPFMQNRAAVTTEDNRGSQYFINQNGGRAFANYRTYVNEHDRYVSEYLLPPLTNGIESMGFYYYDSGLVRVRRQVIDYWNYEMRGLTRVVKDYDCLVRLDGTEVDLPSGYTLEGYSSGAAVLSKDGQYGIYDVSGAWIAQPIYSSATPFISGLSILSLPDGRCGMIDLTGDIVLPFTYDSITLSGSLVLTYRSENGWAVYRIMG